MKLILLQYFSTGGCKIKKKKVKIVRKITCSCEKFPWSHFLPCHRVGFSLRGQQVTDSIGQKTKLHKYGHITYDGNRDFMLINIY